MIRYKNSTCVLIFNDKGELALQLRAAHDDSFPGHWDFSAGGGLDENEDMQVAALRELQEELGITADLTFVCQEHCSYPAWTPGVTREGDLYLFKAKYNGTFNPDANEVERIEFFSFKEIQSLIELNEKFHPEFLHCWNKGLITE